MFKTMKLHIIYFNFIPKSNKIHFTLSQLFHIMDMSIILAD